MSDFQHKWSSISEYTQFAYDNVLSKMSPAEWEAFEPRRIHAPSGYHTSKEIAMTLSTVLGRTNIVRAGEAIKIPLQITIQSIGYELVNHRVPVYYVTDKFARAVAATDLPAEVKISEINWPMQAFVAAFPANFMRDYIGLDVSYIYASKFDGTSSVCPRIPYGPPIRAVEPKVAWFWQHLGTKGIDGNASSYWSKDFISDILLKYDYDDYTSADADEVERCKNATEKVSALMLKLLCVLDWRDGLIKPGTTLHPARTAKNRYYSETVSPTMIGADYRVQRSGADGGTGNGLTFLRRRGHHAYVAVGSRDKLVPVDTMPRTPEGEIDWPNVDPGLRERFLSSHKRTWIDPIDYVK